MESYFHTATNKDIPDETLLSSHHAAELGDLMKYAIIRQSRDKIQCIADLLTSSLRAYLDGALGLRSDFIFFASSYYARSTLSKGPFTLEDEHWDHIPAIYAFLPVLREYLNRRVSPDQVLRERMGIPDFHATWWSFLNFSGEGKIMEVQLVNKAVSEKQCASHIDMNAMAGDLV